MKKERFWEIDFLRGIAIIFMLIFNYSFSLSYLGVYTLGDGFFYWYVFPRIVGATFVFLSGLSLTLFYNQNKPDDTRRKILLRGLKIFGCGMAITAVTFVLIPEAFIIFGVLHLIGFSIVLGQFFLKFEKINLLLGLLIILLGFYLQGIVFDFPWLLWLGFIPQGFYTFDYFPVLPWFGFSLLGIYAGNAFYNKGTRSFKIRDFSDSLIVKSMSFLGRNTLIIYLLHQPALIIVLMALGFKIL